MFDILRQSSSHHLEQQISLSQAPSKRGMIDEWGYGSLRNVGRFFSVLAHNSRFPFFTVFGSGNNFNARLCCRNEMAFVPQRSDFPAVRFVECSLFFFLTRSSHFFVPTCINKQSYKINEPHVSWKKQKATGSIYSKKFKSARKVHAKRKEQNTSSGRGDQSKNNFKELIEWEKTGGIWSDIYD